MPPYAWLLTASVDPIDVQASVRALKKSGVPYTDADVEGVAESLASQGQGVVENLAGANLETTPDREIVALIAYLQRLGEEGKAYLADQGASGQGDSGQVSSGQVSSGQGNSGQGAGG